MSDAPFSCATCGTPNPGGARQQLAWLVDADEELQYAAAAIRTETFLCFRSLFW